MNIVLIGYRGSGKTTVGRELARRLGCPFFDTDLILQGQTGRTIADLVKNGNWDTFRRLERAVIEKVVAGAGDAVIAVGGGVVLDGRNIQLLRSNGVIVWLRAEVETLVTRIKHDTGTAAQRPPLRDGDPGEETAVVLAERLPLYSAAADLEVITDGLDIAGVVEAVIKEVEPWRVIP